MKCSCNEIIVADTFDTTSITNIISGFENDILTW